MSAARLDIIVGRAGVEARFETPRWRRDADVVEMGIAGDAPLFDPLDGPALSAIFERLVRQLPLRAKRRDTKTYIMLPDPVIAEDFIEFRDFPRKPAVARALVEARLARERHVAPEALCCTFKVIIREAGRIVVLARSMERRLRETIEKAAVQMDLTIHWLEAGVARRRMQAPTAQADVVLWLAPESWFLECRAPGRGQYFSDTAFIHSPSADAHQIARTARAFAVKNDLAQLEMLIAGENTLASAVGEICAAYGIAPVGQGSAAKVPPR